MTNRAGRRRRNRRHKARRKQRRAQDFTDRYCRIDAPLTTEEARTVCKGF